MRATMNVFRFYIKIALLTCFSIMSSLHAATLNCVGVLGNSGEQGETTVRFSKKRDVRNSRVGIGIVVDDQQTIWTRAGIGQLNRYSYDGRLLGIYKLPEYRPNHLDSMTRAGDFIVMQLGSQIYTLPFTAKPGEVPKKLDLTPAKIGDSDDPHTFLMLDMNKNLFFVNPVTAEKKIVFAFKDKVPNAFKLAQDQTIYCLFGKTVRFIKDGILSNQEDAHEIRGQGIQLVDGFWYISSWHGTLKRFDQNFKPSPGIVLGGTSGTFIGKVAGNYEISRPDKLIKIAKNLFAVSGLGGIVHLLEWLPNESRFEIVRRIGSKNMIGHMLAVDNAGRVMVPGGVWYWSDLPDTPLRHGFGTGGHGQPVILDNDIVVSTAYKYGSKPSITWGRLGTSLKEHANEKTHPFLKHTSGMVILKKDKKHIAYMIDPEGSTQRVIIDERRGRPSQMLGAFEISTTPAIKNFTTIAKVNDNKVLVGGDGFVVEFDSTHVDKWKEIKRWKNWGDNPEDSFGDEIYLCGDSKNLWVSDTKRQRILGFDIKNGEHIASFGTLDTTGDNLKSFNHPTIISGRSGRVVVFDSENERILKFEIK